MDAAPLAFLLAAVPSFAASGSSASPIVPVAHVAVAQDDDGSAFFEKEIRPILEENCWRCHGRGPRLRAGLDLSTRDGVLRGGDTGSVVDLEHPQDSLLVQVINYRTYEMPPSGKLPQASIDRLTQWVERGLPWAADSEPSEAVETPKTVSPAIDDTTRAHWSFVPVRRPAVPAVQNTAFVRNPVDAFVLASLEAAGLSPAPPASREVFARRASYDLTGLPPSPDAVRELVEDPRPDAEDRWVESLLASPDHGEKWGRAWLDLVRYAETNSFERDGQKPFVWRYRDYVIRAFQDDKPYDQFLREQLAGDELDLVTPESIVATGYYRICQWDDEPADPALAFYDELDDILATTSQAMLGLTMNCARCHDHKLDPIPQRDYYRMLSFFRNVRHYGDRSHESVLDASVRPIVPEAQIEAHAAEVAAHQSALAAAEARLLAIGELVQADFVPVEFEEWKHERNRVALVRAHAGLAVPRGVALEFEALTAERDRLRRSPPPALAEALCVKENGAEAPPTHVLLRGNPGVPGDEVSPGFPSVLGFEDPAIVPPDNGHSTGRRLALARWITSPQNPLTARVMVNRIWQGHFGEGLVRSPNNFGLQGDRPSHPELLDWLAAEFVDSGYSIKHLHRLIVSSNTYRQSGRASPVALDRDPQDHLLHSFPMRRLSAEEIRDSILAVNSRLQRDRRYGPSIYTKIPEAVLAGQSRPGDGWGRSSFEDENRRSIYIHVKRSLIDPILAAFDFADTDFTCPVRFATTQPTQALSLINSEFLHEQSAAFAADLERCHPGDLEAQVRLALARTLQRDVRPQEVSRGLALIRALRDEDGADPERALQLFCLMTLNQNEFLFLE